MFLIREKMLKEIDNKSLRKKVIKQCRDYYNELSSSNFNIHKLGASGYNTKKIYDTDIFKIRFNKGDRILYKYVEVESKKTILFINYVNHDLQILKAKNMDKDPLEDSFIKVALKEEEQNLNEKDLEVLRSFESYVNLENIISIEVRESNFKSVMEEDYIYHLSQKQMEIVKEDNIPIIISGPAGSGKSIISIYKAISKLRNNSNILYVSRTRLLVESMEEIYNKIFTHLGKEIELKDRIEFKTTKELFSTLSGKDIEKILDFKDFKKYMDRYNKGIERKYDYIHLYTEYIGILKGYIGQNAYLVRDLSRKKQILSEEEYKNLARGYSLYSLEERKEVYSILTRFDKYIKKEGLYTITDLCWNILLKKSNLNIYDYIIIDENQDLTELELYTLINLVKDKTQIMFTGDVHQNINLNFFEFYRLRNIFYGLYGKDLNPKLFKLETNYRSTKQIVRVISEISNYRCKHIGKTSYDYSEKAIKEGPKPYIIKSEEKLLNHLMEKIYDKHYCVLVVPSLEEKNRLISLNEKISGRIFIPSEIKGLEYTNVYCVNFLTHYSNEIKKTADKKLTKKDKEAYRYVYNNIYVSFSRGTERLFIFEDVDVKNLNLYKSMEASLDKKFFTPNQKYSMNQISAELSADKLTNIEDLIFEYERLRKSENIEQAEYIKSLMEYRFKDIYSRINFRYGSNKQLTKLFRQAIKLYKKENYNDSIKKFEKILAINNNIDEAYYYLALNYYQQLKLEKSLVYLDKALEVNSFFLEAILLKIKVIDSLYRYNNEKYADHIYDLIKSLEYICNYMPNIYNIYESLVKLYMSLSICLNDRDSFKEDIEFYSLYARESNQYFYYDTNENNFLVSKDGFNLRKNTRILNEKVEIYNKCNYCLL